MCSSGGEIAPPVNMLSEALVSPFNPRTAGGLSHLRTAGGGADDRPPPPPENSKTNKDSDKR